MTSALVAAAGIVALVAAPLGVRWLVHWWHQENHAQHTAGAVFVEQPHEQDFYGSMDVHADHVHQCGCEICLERCKQVRTPGGMLLEYDWSGNYEVIETAPGERMPRWLPAPADPVPYEDLQSDARIEDDRDGTATAAWFHGLGEDPGPGVAISSVPPPGPVQDVPQGPCAAPAVAGAGEVGCTTPAHTPPPSRLADTDDIAQARGWPTVRDMDADVQDWLASRAVTWARLEIGVLT